MIDARGRYDEHSLHARTVDRNRDRLNLGCGEDYRDGWHNVDVSAAVEPDEVTDLQTVPWPWDDDAFKVIEARHVLEHLDSVPWGELVRVLKSGGLLRLTYPIGHTRFEDPTHQQVWNVNTAAALAGERAHAHEHVTDLSIQSRDVEWSLSIDSRLLRWWVKWRLMVDGAGPWLEQVPGLYGEVTAEYRYQP